MHTGPYLGPGRNRENHAHRTYADGDDHPTCSCSGNWISYQPCSTFFNNGAPPS